MPKQLPKLHQMKGQPELSEGTQGYLSNESEVERHCGCQGHSRLTIGQDKRNEPVHPRRHNIKASGSATKSKKRVVNIRYEPRDVYEERE